jgi:hypothetical protein
MNDQSIKDIAHRVNTRKNPYLWAFVQQADEHDIKKFVDYVDDKYDILIKLNESGCKYLTTPINNIIESSNDWVLISNLLNKIPINDYKIVILKAISKGNLNIIYNWLDKGKLKNNINEYLISAIKHNSVEVFKFIYKNKRMHYDLRLLLKYAILNKNIDIVSVMLSAQVIPNMLYYAYESECIPIIEMVKNYADFANELIVCCDFKNHKCIISVFENLNNDQKNTFITRLNTRPVAYQKINVGFCKYLIENKYEIVLAFWYTIGNVELLFMSLTNNSNQTIPNNHHAYRHRSKSNCDIIITFFKLLNGINIPFINYMNKKELFMNFEQLFVGDDDSKFSSYFNSRIGVLKEIPNAAKDKIQSIPYGGTNCDIIKNIVPHPANYIILERYSSMGIDELTSEPVIEILRYYGIIFKGTNDELISRVEELLKDYN